MRLGLHGKEEFALVNGNYPGKENNAQYPVGVIFADNCLLKKEKTIFILLL